MNKQKGFTLVEVMVVVAVLAAVVTIAMPDMNRLFYRQQEMTEALRLKIIKQSLESYSKVNRKLPDKATWAEDLLKYSELSKDQIEKDVWGKDRTYAVFTENNQYLGATYKVYYAIVYSSGRDKVSDASVTIPTNYSGFATFNLTTSTAENGGINDLAIKVTDQAHKMELLETTLIRMERLSLALTKYARVKQISGITNEPNLSDSYIYFPRDGRVGDSGVYYRPGTAEGVETITSVNEASSLAKLLGLPEEYGKDALTNQTMWYISNPGPNSATICVGARDKAPFYPPVIMIKESNPC